MGMRYEQADTIASMDTKKEVALGLLSHTYGRG